MASWEDSEKCVHELIEETAKSGQSLTSKSAIILRLAEASAWLRRADQSHGSSSSAE